MLKRQLIFAGMAVLLLGLLSESIASAGARRGHTRRPPPPRRYSYNYSGVGFPGMEGGLTAAANRTTWLKRP